MFIVMFIVIVIIIVIVVIIIVGIIIIIIIIIITIQEVLQTSATTFGQKMTARREVAEMVGIGESTLSRYLPLLHWVCTCTRSVSQQTKNTFTSLLKGKFSI